MSKRALASLVVLALSGCLDDATFRRTELAAPDASETSDAAPDTPARDAAVSAPDASPTDALAPPPVPGAGEDAGEEADTGTTTPEPGTPDAGSVPGLGPWTGNDNVAPSQLPPSGLRPDQVPMFVAPGFDDLAYTGLPASGTPSGGIMWALGMLQARKNPTGTGNAGTYDGSTTSASFFSTAVFAAVNRGESPALVKRALNALIVAGQDLGDHTYSHIDGFNYSEADWRREIGDCVDLLVRPFDPNESIDTPDPAKGPGHTRDQIWGYRTPFLRYNDLAFTAVKALGFRYDSSIEEGFEAGHDGTNYFWPYTLDAGSPGSIARGRAPLTPHPGLWELPIHAFVVPPDAECAAYGVPAGLRVKVRDAMAALGEPFDVATGKITGFDYNLWVAARMTKAEFLATTKYSFDQHLRGNRSPMMFGAHPDEYSPKYTDAPNSTSAERQQAVEEFLDYVLTKPDARVVSIRQVLEWIRNPVPLR